MAMITIELIVEDFDPFAEEAELVLEEHFPDVLWSRMDGVVTATWTGETNDAVLAAKDFSARLCEISNARPVRWNDDFVGYSEIARRIGVTDEAVRLWANEKRGAGDFPKPWTHIGSQSRRVAIWRWADISNWLVNQRGMESEASFPSFLEISRINSWLCWMDTPDGRGVQASYSAPANQTIFHTYSFTSLSSVRLRADDLQEYESNAVPLSA